MRVNHKCICLFFALIGINVLPKTFSFATKKPLTILPKSSELHFVKNTGRSVEVVPATHSDGMLCGGILGDEVYNYYLKKFYWNENATNTGIYFHKAINGNQGTRLEALMVYYNIKYGSYERAKGHSDGLAQIVVKVNVFKSTPNLLFYPLECVLKKIQTPGEHTPILNMFTYDWLAHFPSDSIYYSYPGSYFDEETSKTYPATTFVFPSVLANYISEEQFKCSFGSLKNYYGKSLVNVAPFYPSAGVPIKKAKYIHLIGLN